MVVNRVKRECKIPKTFIDKFAEAETNQGKKIKIVDEDPVKITPVNEARNMVKIHFKGCSEKFDEWRPCDENKLPVMQLELMSQSTDDSFGDRLHAFCEVCTGRSGGSCNQGVITVRIPKFVLKFKSRTLKTLYCTLICSNLEYGSVV